jgi:hypothetical protein
MSTEGHEYHFGTRRRLVGCVVVVTSLCLASCGTSGVQKGHALAPDPATAIGAKPIRPGAEIGMLYVYVENRSSTPIVLDSVSIAGPGIGTVVREVQINFGPLYPSKVEATRADWAPSSLYGSDPPVIDIAQGCHSQLLRTLHGHKLAPHNAGWIWIVIRAVTPGKYKIPAHVIYYTQNGTTYRQSQPIDAYGSVAATAPPNMQPWATQVCMRPTGAKILPGFVPFRGSGPR